MQEGKGREEKWLNNDDNIIGIYTGRHSCTVYSDQRAFENLFFSKISLWFNSLPASVFYFLHTHMRTRQHSVWTDVHADVFPTTAFPSLRHKKSRREGWSVLCFNCASGENSLFLSTTGGTQTFSCDYRGRNVKVAFLTLIAAASSIMFSHCQAQTQTQNPKGPLGSFLNTAFIVKSNLS